jgi:NNP family nitrate/nitrite transporter-like MFS transporter
MNIQVVTTLAFMVCFAVWMMFGVIGTPIRHEINLSAAGFGLLTATPVYPRGELIVHTVDGSGDLVPYIPRLAVIALLFAPGGSFVSGKATTFKSVGDDFPDSIGVVSGIVGHASGPNRFLLPVIFGGLLDLLRINSSCFVLLYGIAWVPLILTCLAEVRRLPVMS